MNKYFTTPIYYVNGDPHLGHAHSTVMADIFKRSNVLLGNDVFFSTGVDEHGQKNQKIAESLGLQPKVFLDNQADKFISLFKRLNISNDFFARTSQDYHKNVVKKILQKLNDEGKIYKKEYSGLYCEGCEQFKTQADLDEHGNCKDHQKPPILMKETNYFFKMSEYQQWLIDFLKSHEDFIVPTSYRIELLNLLKDPLPDLCISRPKDRVSLGIELPFDTDYVTYVWFDALINYLTNIGYMQENDQTDKYWPSVTHIMAKDIVKTHCIYWPTMLKAMGLEPPKKCLVHGYWVGEDGLKMSKSLGNGINPYEAIDLVGVDGFRFLLARLINKNEAKIGLNILKQNYNSELANVIGNSYYRVITFAKKTFNSIIPVVNPDSINEEESAFIEKVYSMYNNALPKGDDLEEITDLAKTVTAIGKEINLFFDKMAPWKLLKEEKLSDVKRILICCLEAIRMMLEISIPLMPQTAVESLKILGFNVDINKKLDIQKFKYVGGEEILQPTPLFKRIVD